MTSRRRRHRFLGVALTLGSFPSLVSVAQESPRITPTVRVIEMAENAVLPIFTQSGPSSYGSGAGVVIHPKGFVLTSDHVTQNFQGLVLNGLERVPYEIVGRSPERDVSILKLNPSTVRGVLEIGRSNDIKSGEPIVVAGNPAGRGLVFSQGIVNSPSIDPSWPNLLVKSLWRSESGISAYQSKTSPGGRPDFVQFDATSNRGNSGGPLINMEGKVIGVVVTKSLNEEGVNWAIPIDRVRILMPYMIQPETDGGFELGIDVDMLASDAMITVVKEQSSAAQNDVRTGDVILQLDGQPLASGPDWLMLLRDKKPGEEIEIALRRGNETLKKKWSLSPSKSESTISREGKVEGIRYERYQGRFAALPRFQELPATKTGVTNAVGFSGVIKPDDSQFGLVFSGWMDFPEAGRVRMILGSDDGSKLYVDGELIIDNDLPHPYQKLSRWVRVPKGLVPFRVEYADAGGDKQLSFTISKDVEGSTPVSVTYYCERK